MLRALIVDDELDIREGLRNRFPWTEKGIGEVMTADDGDTALLLALDKRPELIVTDIKMNRMSGLDFLRSLTPIEDYAPETIVISGFDDFGLIKQAMQMGVHDYILKPINLDELDQVVSRTLELVTKKRMNERNEQLLRSQVRFAIPKMREELLREMVEHPYDSYRELRRRPRLETLGLDWLTEASLLLVVVETDDLKAIENRRPQEKELILFGMGNVLHQTLEEEYPHPFAMCMDGHNRWIIVLSCARPEQSEIVQGLAQLCIQRINQFVKVKASVGMRTGPGQAKQLHAMYIEAAGVLEQKAVYGGNRLFTEQGLYYDGDRGEISLQRPEEMMDLVKYGTDEEIAAAMDRFIKMVRSWQLTQLRDIQQCIFEWLYELFRRAAAAGLPDKNRTSNPIAVWEQLEQYDTLQSLREQTEAFLYELAGGFRKLSGTPSQIVSEAEKILNRDYAEGLTLQSVANAVHVTPVWLSKLFKKELRKTFLEYLTDIRIEKAKEMLSDVGYKVYQISYQVGYKDPVHFSKLFKKQVGCTPKEFRRQRGIAEE